MKIENRTRKNTTSFEPRWDHESILKKFIFEKYTINNFIFPTTSVYKLESACKISRRTKLSLDKIILFKNFHLNRETFNVATLCQMIYKVVWMVMSLHTSQHKIWSSNIVAFTCQKNVIQWRKTLLHIVFLLMIKFHPTSPLWALHTSSQSTGFFNIILYIISFIKIYILKKWKYT